uniref:Lipocalin n=1 Tax=Rhipicephalus appendiculatus TaxID=34631 RepID=A0A131YS38_RHIAP
MKRKLICLFILALLLAISESQKRIYRRRPHFWIRPMMGLPGEPSSESENACVGEVIRQLPHTYAAFSSDDVGPELLCSTADLTYYSEEEGKLQYTLHIPGVGGTEKTDVTLNYSKTESPYVLTLVLNNDTAHPYTTESLYSDFETCSVFKLYGEKEKCVMWVARGSEDEIPDLCLRQFNCACGPAVPLYIQQICKNTGESK